MSDETIDLRLYLRAVEVGGGAPGWQPIIDAARGCGITEARIIEGLLGVGSRGMVKPSNWVMRREIPIIIALRGSAVSVNQFISERLSDIVQSGTAASETYALDRDAVHAALPNLSADPAAMLRLTIAESENFEGTKGNERDSHCARIGIGRRNGLP